MHRYGILTLAMLIITVSLPAGTAAAADSRIPAGIAYHYVSLADAPLPDGSVFNDPTIGIDDRDRVYGNS